MNDHVPSFNAIVDSIIVRREHTTDQGEFEALSEALATLEAYKFREHRIVGLIERVRYRLASITKGRVA